MRVEFTIPVVYDTVSQELLVVSPEGVEQVVVFTTPERSEVARASPSSLRRAFPNYPPIPEQKFVDAAPSNMLEDVLQSDSAKIEAAAIALPHILTRHPTNVEMIERVFAVAAPDTWLSSYEVNNALGEPISNDYARALNKRIMDAMAVTGFLNVRVVGTRHYKFQLNKSRPNQ